MISRASARVRNTCSFRHSSRSRLLKLSMNTFCTGLHRALLAEIEAAASRPTPATDLAATVAQLEASNAELRPIIRQLQIDKRNLATENLSLLHRARLAEDRLAAHDQESAALKARAQLHRSNISYRAV